MLLGVKSRRPTDPKVCAFHANLEPTSLHLAPECPKEHLKLAFQYIALNMFSNYIYPLYAKMIESFSLEGLNLTPKMKYVT